MMQPLAKQLELHGRYVLVASLLEGRRVLNIGCADRVALDQLVQAGARRVVLAGDGARNALAGADAGTRALAIVRDELSLPISFGDDSFDFVICHDLPERIAADERWVLELRRVLAPDGFLLTAVANPVGPFLSELANERCSSPLEYEQLFDMLSPHFEATTLLGQSPVLASLFFDFEDDCEEPGLSFDRSLLPDDDEVPSWYVLLFGPEAIHRDELSITQLPYAQTIASLQALRSRTSDAERMPPPVVGMANKESADVEASDPSVVPADERERIDALEVRQLKAEMSQQRATTLEMQAWIGDARKHIASLQSQATALTKERNGLQAQATALTEERDGLRTTLRSEEQARVALEEELAGARAAAQGLESRAQQAEARLTGLEEEASDDRQTLEQDLAAAVARGGELAKRVEELETERDALLQSVEEGRAHTERTTDLHGHAQAVLCTLEDEIRQAGVRHEAQQHEVTAQIAVHQRELSERDAALDALQKDLVQAKAQATDFSARVEELEANCRNEQQLRAEAEQARQRAELQLREQREAGDRPLETTHTEPDAAQAALTEQRQRAAEPASRPETAGAESKRRSRKKSGSKGERMRSKPRPGSMGHRLEG